MSRPSYLTSYLASVASQLPAAEAPQQVLAFEKKFKGDWLVWEPGTWQAPSARGTLTTLHAQPNDFSLANPDAPIADALCFLLGGPADGVMLRIGRDETCDVVVNDGTVSRRHAVVTGIAGYWNLSSAADRPVLFGRRPLLIGQQKRLFSGEAFVLGGAMLTFYDAVGLVTRLRRPIRESGVFRTTQK
jgi:FHA domain